MMSTPRLGAVSPPEVRSALLPRSRERVFTSAQFCIALGISYRRLDYWVRTGLLEADVRSADGSGSQRLFSEEQYQAGLDLVERVAACPLRHGRLDRGQLNLLP